MTEWVRPGRVDWTGDNPFIYLKSRPDDAEWSTLSLFFRVTASELGRGHAILVVETPGRAVGDGELARVCLTDNAPLASWLIEEFVRHMGVFRDAAGLRDVEVIDGAEFAHSASADGRYSERGSVAAAGLEIAMTWAGLGPAFAVDVQPEASATGRHEMFSAFRIAETATVTVNSRQLPGEPVFRDFFNGRSKSAALAFSETWVLAK